MAIACFSATIGRCKNFAAKRAHRPLPTIPSPSPRPRSHRSKLRPKKQRGDWFAFILNCIERMPGICFCCLSSDEKVHMIMTNFGALQRLDQLEVSESPQFLCGRILPIQNQVLIAPISGKPCVYYEAFVEEQQEKTDENGIIGIPDADEPHKVWIPLFREVKAVNFAIVDPQFPDICVYAPGGKVSIQVLANEDTITRSRLRSKLIVRDHTKQQSTKVFCLSLTHYLLCNLDNPWIRIFWIAPILTSKEQNELFAFEKQTSNKESK